MPLDLAALTLLHVLVFVYWLGGDLGAFYASSLVTDAKRPAEARAAAAMVVANVDMAPRSALILAFPTGASLAAVKGLWPGALVGIGLIWAAALAWLALAWWLHLRHAPPSSPWRRIDLAIRWCALAGLLGAAAFATELPDLIRAKAGLLAVAIGLGLLIRKMLAPFGGAFGAIMAQGSTPEREAILAGSLGRARLVVMMLWLVIGTAAFLGISGGAGWMA